MSDEEPLPIEGIGTASAGPLIDESPAVRRGEDHGRCYIDAVIIKTDE